MKKLLPTCSLFGVWAALTLPGWRPLQAQIVTSDTVTITAPDPRASEAGPDPGLFEIRRSGPTNFALSVFYQVAGTASNGVDYEKIPEAVVIPEGSLTTSIPVKPMDDTLIEGPETVVLQIVPSLLLCPTPACGYDIGWPSNATVIIADNERTAGSVNIYATDPVAREQPALSAVAPDTATFTVRRSGGTNESIVVYYAISGTASNGVDYEKLSGQVAIPEGESSAEIVVVPIDDDLIEGTETVVLTLIAPCPQCLFAWPPCEVPQGTNCYPIGPDNKAVAYIWDNDQTNIPPRVRISSPSDGALFTAPANIKIEAVAVDPDGYVGLVEIFDGTNKIREDGFVYAQWQPPPGVPVGVSFVWSNVMAGEHVLSAKATDSQGASGLSRPVRIFVTATNRPPGTNLPIVTIFAADPVAVEGVFCLSNWWWTSSGSSGGWTTNSAGWRTNYCVTNTATFVVRRSGATNSELTIYYALGGTASNGVDYLTLPGRVTIPAGHRAARVVVEPIDDGIPEGIETVLLGLQPPPSASADVPPAYLLGFPSRAAAVILDNDQPRPPCRMLRDGMFHLCVPGTNGYTFSLQASTDMVNWTSLCTNIVTEGAVHFVDPDATDFAERFYQVAPEPNYSPPDSAFSR